MAKHRYDIDEAKISKFIQQGRGTGHGAKYRPWLTIHDVPSTGRSARPRGRTTGREHHLLSDIEHNVFAMLDWSDVVTDIREQFPLDRDQTRRIASEMGIPHPTDVNTRCEIVMTTDFLVDVIDHRGCVRQIARSCKKLSKLGNARVLEKQEIERRYWQKAGTEWGIVTEQDVDPAWAENIRFLHEMLRLENQEAPRPGYWQAFCEALLSSLRTAPPDVSIKSVLQRLEGNMGSQSGDGLKCFRHLAANKYISFDLAQPLSISAPIKSLSFTQTNSTNAEQGRA